MKYLCWKGGELSSLARILLTALILALTSFIASCVQSEDKKVKIRAVFWAGIEEQKAEHIIIEEFEKKNPKIDVSLESIPDNYFEKLVTAFAAGKPPDVLLLDSVIIPKFVEANVLLDLSPFLQENPNFREEDYFGEVFQIGVKDGKVYSLPKDFTPMVVYYNKKIFDEAKVPYPKDGWTWQDFLGSAKAITTKNENPREHRYGCLVAPYAYQNIFWLWQNNGDVLSPDGTYAVGFLDSKESIEAIRFYTELVTKHHVAPDPTTRQALGGEIFQTGKVAMVVSGHWWIPTLRASRTKEFSLENIGIVGLPRNKSRVTTIYESGWAVAKKSKHPSEAVSLAIFLSSAEAQKVRATILLAIPAAKSVAEDVARKFPIERKFLDEVKYARPPWGTRISEWNVVEDLFQELIERIILGYGTPEEAARQTAKLIDAELSMFRGK